MTPEDIRVALESAIGILEQAMRAAVKQAADFAPAVIKVVRRMADGQLPSPHEEKLMRSCMLWLPRASNYLCRFSCVAAAIQKLAQVIRTCAELAASPMTRCRSPANRIRCADKRTRLHPRCRTTCQKQDDWAAVHRAVLRAARRLQGQVRQVLR